jgi:hypothetical protein
MNAVDGRAGIANIVDDVTFRVVEIIVSGRRGVAGDKDELRIPGYRAGPLDVERIFDQIVDATGLSAGGVCADL